MFGPLPLFLPGKFLFIGCYRARIRLKADPVTDKLIDRCIDAFTGKFRTVMLPVVSDFG